MKQKKVTHEDIVKRIDVAAMGIGKKLDEATVVTKDTRKVVWLMDRRTRAIKFYLANPGERDLPWDKLESGGKRAQIREVRELMKKNPAWSINRAASVAHRNIPGGYGRAASLARYCQRINIVQYLAE